MSEQPSHLQQGRDKLARQDYRGALAHADALLALAPESAPAMLLRGRALYHLGRDAEALQALRQIDALVYSTYERDRQAEEYACGRQPAPAHGDDPQSRAELLTLLLVLRERVRLDHRLLKLLAALADAAGHTDVARTAYEEMLREDPADIAAWEELIHLQTQNDLDAALATLSQALQTFPEHPLFHEFTGFIYYRRRRFRRAIEAYRQAMKLGADHAENYQALAQCHLAMGDTGAVLDLLRLLEQRWADDAAVLRFVVEIGVQTDHLEIAQAAVHHLLRLRPSHAETYQYKALVEIARREWDAAERTLRLGFHKAVTGARTLFMLVDWLIDAAALEDAMRVAELAFVLAPEHPESLAARGKVFREMGAFSEALEAFRQAAKRAPSDDIYLTWQGVALDNMGNYAGALRAFDEVLSRHPTDVWTLCNRGLSHLAAADTNRAIADFTHGIAIDPHDAPLFFWRACALVKSGQPGEALRDLHHAVDLSEEVQLWLKQEPALDPLRQDPRFRALLYPPGDEGEE